MSQSKLYVGNLSFQVDDADLREIFTEYGTVVDAKVITDRDSGRSRGFGFVEMQTSDEAAAAIEGLNNAQLEGRPMQVSVARPRANRGDSAGAGGSGGFRRESRW